MKLIFSVLFIIITFAGYTQNSDRKDYSFTSPDIKWATPDSPHGVVISEGYIKDSNPPLIKIGDISISEELAKEYFLDCYKHPDTFKKKSPSVRYAVNGWGVRPPKTEEELRIDKFNEWLDDNNIKVLRKYGVYKGQKYIEDEWYLVPRTPSASDFAAFMRRKYKQP